MAGTRPLIGLKQHPGEDRGLGPAGWPWVSESCDETSHFFLTMDVALRFLIIIVVGETCSLQNFKQFKAVWNSQWNSFAIKTHRVNTFPELAGCTYWFFNVYIIHTHIYVCFTAWAEPMLTFLSPTYFTLEFMGSLLLSNVIHFWKDVLRLNMHKWIIDIHFLRWLHSQRSKLF